MNLNSLMKNPYKIPLMLATLGVVSYIVHIVPYMGALGSILVVLAYIILLAQSIKLNLTQKKKFWTSLIMEATGGVIYIMHLVIHSLRFLDLTSFLLFVVGFILLFRSQIQGRN